MKVPPRWLTCSSWSCTFLLWSAWPFSFAGTCLAGWVSTDPTKCPYSICRINFVPHTSFSPMAASCYRPQIASQFSWILPEWKLFNLMWLNKMKQPAQNRSKIATTKAATKRQTESLIAKSRIEVREVIRRRAVKQRCPKKKKSWARYSIMGGSINLSFTYFGRVACLRRLSTKKFSRSEEARWKNRKSGERRSSGSCMF